MTGSVLWEVELIHIFKEKKQQQSLLFFIWPSQMIKINQGCSNLHNFLYSYCLKLVTKSEITDVDEFKRFELTHSYMIMIGHHILLYFATIKNCGLILLSLALWVMKVTSELNQWYKRSQKIPVEP